MYQALVKKQREYFQDKKTKPLAERIEDLESLRENIRAREADILEALKKDLGKSAFEAYATEVGYVLNSLRDMMKNLRSYARDERVPSPLYQWGMKSYIHYEPKGVVLIIGPFNYPFQLVIEPLIGALAAGNCVVLKPSEMTPHTEKVIASLIEETFAPEQVAVVTGGKEVTGGLLEQTFNHIFFTGSARVGRIVLKAAAKKLTPVTLELGGKSPAIVCRDACLEEASRRIVWGKFLNAGQTCVAPDYLLVHEEVKEELTQLLVAKIQDFYGKNPQDSPDYGRIVDDGHWARLVAYLGEGKIIHGGDYRKEDRYLAPTLLTDPVSQAKVMEEEIFGPVLPILTFSDLDKEVQALKDKPAPLALYIFTQDMDKARWVTETLSFGNGAINDTVSQVASVHLPFGGLGPSGMGAYHGRYSFLTFSHAKAMVRKKRNPFHKLIMPPYKDQLKLIRHILK